MVMKPAEAPTLSQHLLREASRFFIYPHKVYRSKLNLATQKFLEEGIKRLIDWRRTFSPDKREPPDELFTSEVMLDQIYCRLLLQDVPDMVARTRALAQ
jgi:hypothetical protein